MANKEGFTIAKNKRKISRSKSNRTLYAENYKTLTNEIKEHLNKWKNMACL